MKICTNLHKLNLTLTTRFLYRRYVNIRVVRQQQTKKHQQSKQLYDDIINIDIKAADNPSPTQPSLQLTPQQKLKFEKLKIGENLGNSQEKMTKDDHSINFTIKNTDKTSTLFKILRKSGHKLNIKQYISLFERLVYLENHSNQNFSMHEVENSPNIDKYDTLIANLQRVIFKQSQPPQIYVRFINAYSKLQNEYIFNKAYDKIFLKIMNCELLPQFNMKKEKQRLKKQKESAQNTELKPKQEPAKNNQEEISETILSQMLSIENNVKLALALLRIYNHKINQPDGVESKLILALLRNVVNYIHLPITPAKVSNLDLFTLIEQYIVIYPKLKLSNPLLKSLTTEVLARVKRIGVVNELKNMDQNKMNDSVSEGKMVKTLKKLFTLQKLLNQNFKIASLHQQIMETKPNNIVYHPFYALQKQIHKNIIYLLPKCTFDNHKHIYEAVSEEPEQSAWTHIELVNFLTSHIELLFIKVPVQALARCDLLLASYEQYQTIMLYLKNLYEHIINVKKIQQLNYNQKLNYWRLLSNSYHLLYLMLSKPIQSHIPSAIVNKNVNQRLFKLLIAQFTDLPQELQTIIIWNIIQKSENLKNIQHKLLLELIQYMLKTNVIREQRPILQERISINIWYIQLLLGNNNYLQLITEKIISKDEYKARECLKTLISALGHYNFPIYQGIPSLEVYKKVASNVVNHIKKWQNNISVIEKLISIYQRQSKGNCLFTQHQINLLQLYSKSFMQLNSKNDFVSNKEVDALRKKTSLKINQMLARAQFMFRVVSEYFEQREGKQEYLIKIAQIFKIEFKLLKYPGLLTSSHAQAIGRIKMFIPHSTQIPIQNFEQI